MRYGAICRIAVSTVISISMVLSPLPLTVSMVYAGPENTEVEPENTKEATENTEVEPENIDESPENTKEAPKYTEEEMSVGGYVEMPWDKNLPKKDPRISFEDAKDILVYEDDSFRDVKKGITDREPAAAYPASYEDEEALRAHISTHLPPLRDQSPYGTCWAHSSMALMETYLMNNSAEARDKNGTVTRDNADYSELQLTYFYYRKLANPMVGDQGDQVSLIYGNLGSNETRSILDFGGNTGLAAQVLMNWKGAVDEEALPYSYASTVASTEAGTSGTRPGGISDEMAFDEDSAHLKNEYQINITTNPVQVKQAIMSNGIVGAGYCHASDYYDDEHNSYYCDTKYSVNHSVCIVGWDDAFPKESFNDTPETDGAWLIRNSWLDESAYGSSDIFSEQGYFWMSYCDKSLANGTAYVFEADTSEDYDHNYSYTPNIHSKSYYNSEYISYANVYTASGYETLKAVSFETGEFSGTADYNLEVYSQVTRNSENKTLTLGGSPSSQMSGSLLFPGIYTIELTDPVNLEPGQEFAIVLGSSSAIVCREASMNATDYANKNYRVLVSIGSGESYWKYESKWIDINDGTSGFGNFCINALTADRNPQTQGRIGGLKLSDFTKNSVSLKWDAFTGAEGYLVQRASVANTAFTTIGTVEGETVFTDTGLTPDKYYFYRIIPMISGSTVQKSRSDVICARTAPASVATAESINFSIMNSDVPILWVETSGSVKGCAVYYKKTVDGDWTRINAKDLGGICLVYLNDFPPGEYSFKAACFEIVNGVEYYGSQCDPISLNISAPPVNVRGWYDGNNVRLTWDTTDGSTYFRVFCDGSFVGRSSSTSFSYAVSPGSGTHQYTVRAQKGTRYELNTIWAPSDPATVNTDSENYVVIFNSKGGSAVPSQNVNVGSKAARPEDPEKEGSTFLGWYIDSGCTTPYDFNTVMAHGKGNVILYAKWGGYSVSFAPGEGRGNMTSMAAGYGSTITLPACAFTAPSGKRFNKWRIGETDYDPGDEITVYTNLTATAMWTDKVSQTLSFAESTANKTYGTDTTYRNPLTGAKTAVIYESNNESVATVAANGTVTIRGSGSATITATAAENETYYSASASFILTVNKGAAGSSAPSARNITYNGSAQTLITAGTATGGTMYYTLTEEGGTAPEFDGTSIAADRKWKTAMPTAKNAGSYKVYYMVAGDDNHYNTEVRNISVTVSPKSLTIKANDGTITYGDAPAGNGVTCEGFAGSDDLTSLSGTLGYDSNYPRYGDVGSNYTITPKGLSSGNYSITYSSGKLTVVKKEIGILWSGTTLTYNGATQKPSATATGLVNEDNCDIAVDGGKIDAGEYTATAYSVSNSNYVLPQNKSVTYKILKADSMVSSLPKAKGNLVYNGYSKQLITKGTEAGGTLMYTIGTDDSASSLSGWSTSIPSGTAAGTYYVYYKVFGDSNHNDTDSSLITVYIDRATTPGKTISDSEKFGKSASINLSSKIESWGSISGISSVTDEDSILDGSPSLSGKSLTYRFKDIPDKAGKSATVTIAVNGDGNHYGYNITVTLNVLDKQSQRLTFYGMSEGTYTRTYGNPDFTKSALLSAGNGTISYSSSDETVATVDPSSGKVHILKPGETYIEAVAAETDDYYEGRASYKLLVGKRTVNLLWSDTYFTYDGMPHSPKATVENLINNDTCSVTVEGSQTVPGDYTAAAVSLSNDCYSLPADASRSFTIDKASIHNASITLGDPLTYNGTSQSQEVAGVSLGSLVLSPDDYVVTDNTVIDAGTYHLSITAAEDSCFKGFIQEPFEVAKKTIFPTAGPVEDQEYTGYGITPYISVKNEECELEDYEYTLTYENNTDPGIARILINPTDYGNYRFDEIVVEFEISRAGHSEVYEWTYPAYGEEKSLDLGDLIESGGVYSIGPVDDPCGILEAEPSISSGILSFSLKDDQNNVGKWAEITVSVRDSDIYLDYNIVVTIEVTDKEAENSDPDPENPDPENPKPVDPDPETPDPENPEPLNPDPENLDPENPEPVNPDPESPDPENPAPENPDPENPDPENPEPENPDPENPEPVNPDPATPDPENPVPAEPDPAAAETEKSVREEVVFTGNSGESVTLIRDTVNNTYETKSGEKVVAVSDVSGNALPRSGYEYTGKKLTPGKMGYVLFEGSLYQFKKDYTISYKANKKPGTATAVIKWKKNSPPNLSGIKKSTVSFAILPRTVTADMVNISPDKKGGIKKITVHADGLTIKVPKKDFTFTGSTENGFEIVFSNNFTGTVRK